MADERDYTFRTFGITATVVVLMLGLSFVPGFRVGGISLKRANIVSDLIRAEDSSELLMADAYFDTTFLSESADAASAERIDSARSLPAAATLDWSIGGPVPPSAGGVRDSAAVRRPSSLADTAEVVEIEDFSGDDRQMDRFYRALGEADRRPVRIAVLGDSFIEGDIFTADLREQFQTLYGGRGVGFVPFSSPVAQFRGSVKHSFSGWTTYSVVQKKSAPEEIRDKFSVSGSVSVPDEGAEALFEGTSFRRHLQLCSSARLLFINEGRTVVHVTVNDSLQRLFRPDSTPFVQQICVTGEIRKLRVRVTEPAGFYGYGVVFGDDTGVGLDNYSIRGNSGLALFGTNSVIDAQIGRLLGFDLVVLQYGLNAMSPEAGSYDGYGTQLSRIVDFVERCFPGSSLLVMGIGDRSTRQEGEMVTMPGVPLMIEAQRAAARRSGVAFWNTFRAMGGEGSIAAFVERGWAAKDYTHIGFAGGRYVARRLAASLMRGEEDYLVRMEEQRRRRREEERRRQDSVVRALSAADTLGISNVTGNGYE